MPPRLRFDYFFNQRLKLFKKVKPHLFAFCFLPAFRKYSLSEDFYKRRFPQPGRFRRTRYFKYDVHYWNSGLEGAQTRFRLSFLLRSYGNFSKSFNSILTKSLPSKIDYAVLAMTSEYQEPSNSTKDSSSED